MADFMENFSLSEYLGLDQEKMPEVISAKKSTIQDKYIRLSKTEHDNLLEGKKIIVENIKISEKIRQEINKDIKNGVDPVEILIKSIECIGLITGDNTFTKQNISTLKAVK